MRTDFRHVPDQERTAWAYWLNCEPSLFDKLGLHILPNPRLINTITVLNTSSAMFASIPETKIIAYQAKFDALRGYHIITLSDIITAVQPITCGYILHQGTLDELSPVDSPTVTYLSGDSLTQLKNLEENCHPTEWEHSSLNYESNCTYACIVDEHVVAAGHYIMLHETLASIGILTHPAFRGRGFSKTVASSAMQHALNQNLVVHYQTLLENRPAITLAHKLGIKFYGYSMRLTIS